MNLHVTWIDYVREPVCKPNPDYPDGKDIVAVTDDDAPTCKTSLPYPAKRCGMFIVRCGDCDLRVGITTAGRPDDPRSVTLMCAHTKEQGCDTETTAPAVC